MGYGSWSNASAPTSPQAWCCAPLPSPGTWAGASGPSLSRSCGARACRRIGAAVLSVLIVSVHRMPSSLHETLVEMFRHRPSLAVELLVGALGMDLPAHERARVEAGEFTDVAPTEYRADAVVVLTAASRVDAHPAGAGAGSGAGGDRGG